MLCLAWHTCIISSSCGFGTAIPNIPLHLKKILVCALFLLYYSALKEDVLANVLCWQTKVNTTVSATCQGQGAGRGSRAPLKSPRLD